MMSSHISADTYDRAGHRVVAGAGGQTQKRDGRSCYDRDAKSELIEASPQPEISVAAMALRHWINSNLLHTWIRPVKLEPDGGQAAGGLAPTAQLSPAAFVPAALAESAVKADRSRLEAQFPSGVGLNLS